jgi:N-acetylmuramoyl-L-alanine amidase
MLDFGVVTHVPLQRFLLPLLTMLLLMALLGSASAQSCTGYVSVDGTLLEGEAACYFGPSEGAQSAYIRTDLLTAALGLESDYLLETGTLRFEKGGRTVDLATTDEVASALRARPEALVVDGQAQAGRRAILAGSSYLPLAELVGAFGGSVSWNGAASLVVVDFGAENVEASRAPEPDAAEPAPSDSGLSETIRPQTKLAAPRYAVYEEGYTRVAVDVPAGTRYRLAVDGDNFIVLFESAWAEPYQVTPDGVQLGSLGYTPVGDGALALIAGTRYPLSASGRGFEVGRLDREEGSQTLYIDFSPVHRGERVAHLRDLPRSELAAVKRPGSVQKTVVIDPGHGGEDPGAVSDYIAEKDLVLSVGLMLKEKLEARGVNVEMTRDDDTFVELEDRARFAVPSQHNLFISLHANATETAGAEGIETWVFGEPQDDSLIELAVLENGGGDLGRERTVRAREAAASIDGDLLREENLVYSTVLAESVQHDLVGSTGSANRGVRENYFVVLREARVPAVLVELGFVDHAEEGPKLADAAYQQRLAEALADGVEAFLAQGGSLAASGTPKSGN